VVGGFNSLEIQYTVTNDELLSVIPILPETVTDAVYNLDKIVERRTTNTRLVTTGTAATTYTVPLYEVGQNKLFVFVDGIKSIASTQGYQRASFPLNPLGSPSVDTPVQIDCTVPIADPDLPIIGSPPQQYGFEVSVDGGLAQTITIDPTVVDSQYTFCDMIADINGQLVGAYATLEDSGIVIYSDSHGTGSSILITDGDSGSPATIFPLFASINYFDSLETPVDGVTYGYNEIGGYAELSESIEFNSSVDTSTIEFIVAGQSGIPL
jgi:hypothetical protein